MKNRVQRPVWVINTKSSEGHGWLGIYWFSPAAPPWSNGNTTATFKTRKSARMWMKLVGVKKTWPRATVEKVNLEVCPV